ncbi:MAG: hypothetical protein K2K56_10080 [Lachnospiraceae bacterium]|nr:hypothetical protein [Lachnospiraceae bacterium]
MGDDAFKVFLNASGDKSGIPEELAEFLNYLSGESPKDMFTKRLDDLLRQAREHKKWEVEYMTLEMQYREKYKEGLADGEERAVKLMNILAENGLIEEMKRAAKDKEYRESLFKKYNL